MRGTRARSSTRSPLRAALLGAAAAVVLSACGGGSGTTSAAGSSGPPPAGSTSSAPSTSAAAAAGSDFCTQARAFATDASQAVSGGADNPDVAQQLQALVGRLRSIDPPPAIASDWQSAVSSLQQFAQAYQGIDLSDPQQVAQLQQRLAPMIQQLSASGERVDAYLQTQCGISVGGDTSGSASPSS